MIQNQFFNGWKTTDKIVVFESDDWGTERIPSLLVRDQLAQLGLPVFQNSFTIYDTLESSEDLEFFISMSDDLYARFGKRPIITTNTIMANPDFEKIESSSFEQYYFESFEDSYMKKYNSTSTFSMLNQAIEKGVMKPQFHGREHVQAQLWLKSLKEGSQELHTAFKNGVFGLELKKRPSSHSNLTSAWNYQSIEEKEFVLNSIEEGIDLFHKTFGFIPKTSIAPVGIWSKEIESTLLSKGVQSMQSFVKQRYPDFDHREKEFRFTGQISESGINYLVRNCFFEPSTNPKIDWVRSCFKQIQRAFYFNKPAIVSMHRINFVGGIELSNRTKSIQQFSELVSMISSKWNDVQFLSSDQLSDKINKETVK